MNKLVISPPEWLIPDGPDWLPDGKLRRWHAEYSIAAHDDVRYIQINARSGIEVVVAKLPCQFGPFSTQRYYASSPNFGVAIPAIDDMEDTDWTLEHLIDVGMPWPDAVTVAQVLCDIGNY